MEYKENGFLEIGKVCRYVGCNTKDFLPCICHSCNTSYCGEHLSRFKHDCHSIKQDLNHDIIESSTSEQPNERNDQSFEDLMNSLIRQVKGDTLDTETITEIKSDQAVKVKSSAISEDVLAMQQLSTIPSMKRLNTLLQDSTKLSVKDRKRVLQTKNSILKHHSKGDESIPYDERLYLTLYFPMNNRDSNPNDCEQGFEVYTFYSKSQKLANLLFSIANEFPQLLFDNCANRPEDMSAVLFTSDTPQWEHWDRNQIISDLLHPFETISVIPMPISKIVANQTKIDDKNVNSSINNRNNIESEYKIKHDDAKHDEINDQTPGENNQMDVDTSSQEVKEAIAPANQSNSMLSSSPRIIPSSEHYKKGDLLQYKTSSGELQIVVIVGVHLDDFPNVYYTITEKANTSKERQTDHSRLIPFGKGDNHSSTPTLQNQKNIISMSSNTEISDMISFIVIHGSNNYEIIDVDHSISIGMLKAKLENVTAVPRARMKLICKGTILKDSQNILKDTKITRNSKVSLVGSSCVSF